jgi:hypothetical protein
VDVIFALTVKNLTPPGYFNLSPSAKAPTVAYTTWWNNILSDIANNSTDLKQMILTPWLMDYPSTPLTPWLSYLLSQYGVAYFGGTNNQAAYLYRLLSSAWSTSTIANITLILQTLSMPPFSWFTTPAIGIIEGGQLIPVNMDTGFLIYSTAASPPTPSPTAYTARAWAAPAGWTIKSASAVSYSRGYRTGGNITWCAPRPVSDFNNAYVYSATVPVSVPSVGTIAIVRLDGTGDVNSVYYSDGAAWRKNSMVNVDLGLVIQDGDRPSPEAITVWAPDQSTVPYSIESDTPPPVLGDSQGYGTFSGWAETTVFSNAINVQVTQISGGTVALATLFEVLRRVKPVNKNLSVDVSGVQYTITDVRQK